MPYYYQPFFTIYTDRLLVEKGYVGSRAAAQKLITAGAVAVQQQGLWLPVAKVSQQLPPDCQFRLSNIDELKYVSRAGLKLEAALHWLVQHHAGPLKKRTALDIGQSTGGFTDCLLSFGLAKVLGIDVGHSQLADKLRNDPRVVCIEGQNARALPQHLLQAHAPDGFDFCVVDVSFISQTKILPHVAQFLRPGGLYIGLIKPQFECGKAHLGKNGLVTTDAARANATELVKSCAVAADLSVHHLLPSPITGAEGNLEYLLIAERCA